MGPGPRRICPRAPRCASLLPSPIVTVSSLRAAARGAIAQVAEAVEQRSAPGLLVEADLEHADLARGVGGPLARLLELVGVPALHRGRGVEVELVLVDLAGGEVGPGVLDGAGGELGAE